MSDLGFVWDVLLPTSSGPTTAGKVPLTVQTALDPDSLDDGLTGITIHWGDGTTTSLTSLDWDMRVNHTFTRPGTYHAKAVSVPAGETRKKTFLARAMDAKAGPRRTRYIRPH